MNLIIYFFYTVKSDKAFLITKHLPLTLINDKQIRLNI